MGIKVPIRNNKELKELVKRIDGDVELLQIWKCANVNAVDRSGISDHGQVHIRIVANAALRIIRLLIKGGIEPSVVTHHGLTAADAEVVVVLAACLHDTGISVHRDNHERYSLFIAFRKARELLEGIYEDPALTTMVSETLHAIVAHAADEKCLTIEAGALKVADATDMSAGRSRIPFEAGQVNIHSVSARAVESVNIVKGEKKPVRIEIKLANSAGIFQVDELLKNKLKFSPLTPFVEVVARIEGETERSMFNSYTI
ncbi:MAG: phosphohydrolase [Armatimonadetes bacterium CG07_land_8_20_14_0_80_59_28]|nr:MAG: phosphohydrolase [Armatimonadetes bacterium CG07_land_8_20_14_0_80_59_28]PIX38035.1 MAG: phosphohydrolase [Armatimonadetes bacterium CG_4_8_14_3_um_filter_58_9]PIY42049.1 MAG: phosphohydrolase [Armatimonadetes bacterium CG_4_10_14_3_um_filter_59_10]PJB61531.1 MAG: phosphohydrolase [Armatimonadetes bacterium CG_4_9_14_3_um_filter_58_7]